MALGQKLKLLREERGMNQSELAEASGVNQATISRIESGEMHQLKSDALKRLARVLGVTIDSLLDFELPLSDEIERVFRFVMDDPQFKYGTRLQGELDREAKLFIIELYEKATGKKLLTKGVGNRSNST